MRSRTSEGSGTVPVGSGDTESTNAALRTHPAVDPDANSVRQRPAGGCRGRQVDDRRSHTSTADDSPTGSPRRGETSLGSALEDSARDVNRPCGRRGDTGIRGCGAATTVAPNETEQYDNNQ
jgi:hypothetical protein